RLRPQGLLRLLLAEQVEAGKSRLVAGLLFLQWGQTISYTSAGWRWEDQALRPNDLLHWQAIQDACAEGLRCYDFGYVTVGNQSLAQFKSKWGTQKKMLYHYSCPAVARGTRTISASGQSRSAVRQLVRPVVRSIRQHLPIKAIELWRDWCSAIHYY
ncbi:MAG TPA: GNAT family N-acetyltransferase, partial [Ktedonobacteraceae bacterium]|nr:GNAT family N-acetyltransferase [Ktedonobacteraceae bacterium]